MRKMVEDLHAELACHGISWRIGLDKLAGKKVVIIDVEELQYAPFVFPVADLLRQDERVSVYYSTLKVYKNNELFRSRRIPPQRIMDVRMCRRMSRANLFLSAHIHALGPGNAVRVHMFHNQPVKYPVFPLPQAAHFKVHFSLGPLSRKWTEDMIARYALEDQGVQLFNIGYPKLDDLVQGKYDRTKVLQSLGLNEKLPTVLYAPSWDDGLSLRTSGVQVVECLLGMQGINLLVKLHPVSCVLPDHPEFGFYTGGVQWPLLFKKYDGHPRYRLLTTPEINDILIASDIMVTDVSSVALEYMILDRPIIYFDSPEFFKNTTRKIYNGYGYANYDADPRLDPMINAGRHTGMVIGDVSELASAVQRCLANPQELSAKRRELIQQLLYNPGKASHAAAGAVLQLLGLSDGYEK